MNLNLRRVLMAVLGLAVAGPGIAQAQTENLQDIEARLRARTQAQSQSQTRRQSPVRRGASAGDRYWDSYWNWYDSSYRPYYHGRSRMRGDYGNRGDYRDRDDRRERGYFGDRYGGRDIDDYQDWRRDYYRDRYRGRDRSQDIGWTGRDFDYSIAPRYDTWYSPNDRSGWFDTANPGHFTGYGGGWR